MIAESSSIARRYNEQIPANIVHRYNDTMPKPAQLVCQHLENISGDVLEDYQDIIRGLAHTCFRNLRRVTDDTTMNSP